MTLYAFDGASPFDLAAAKANGAVVITGYVIGRPGGMAPIDKSRVDQVRSMGMLFLPNAELAADFFQTCTLAEAAKMGADTAAANRDLGIPADGTVATPASFDFDFTDYEAKYQKLLAYGRGLNGYLPRAYGPYGFLEYITQPGRMPGTKHWLMMSTFGRPYNPASPAVCMVQEHTLSGAWLNSPVAATDISTITDLEAVHAYGGTDMPLDATDKAWLTQMTKQTVHDEVVALLSDPYHEYFPPLHKKLAAQPAQAAGAVWSAPISDGTNALTAAQRLANPPVSPSTVQLDPAQVDAIAAKVAAAVPAVSQEQIKAALAGQLFSGTTSLTVQGA